MDLSVYKQEDFEDVKQLFIDTFSASESSEEGFIVGGLFESLVTETDQKDILGFVATDQNKIIGSIVFTRLTFQHEINAFLLSPVAVEKNYQGQGIGQRLISYGISRLKERGVALVFTYGDPSFYSKVGFRPVSEEIIQAPVVMSQPEGWLGQPLVAEEIIPIAERPCCVDALNKPEYW